MRDWNVVVTVKDRGFTLACELLGEYGLPRQDSVLQYQKKVANGTLYRSKMQEMQTIGNFGVRFREMCP